MSRKRSPQEKKQDRYDDHVVKTEYSIRKAWPRKKRHANQKTRTRVRDILNSMAGEESLEAYPPQLVSARPRTVGRKATLSVRERVEHQLELRRSRLGWNYFTTSYQEALHRERFAAFLRSLIAGHRGEARHNARIVRWWLEGSPAPSGRSMHPGRAEWLESFFRQEPALERELEKWINRTLAGKGS